MTKVFRYLCWGILLVLLPAVAFSEPDDERNRVAEESKYRLLYTPSTDILQIIEAYVLDIDTDTDCFEIDIALDVLELISYYGYDTSTIQLNKLEPIYVFDFLLAVCELGYGDYLDWSIELKHRFDRLMVDIGQLQCCFNLLPDDNELSQNAAFDLALAEIENRYNYNCDGAVAKVSYVRHESGDQKGVWRFSCSLSNDISVSVHIYQGSVIWCKVSPVIGAIDIEYEALCDKRGAFFKWSIADKVNFALTLPYELANARARNEQLPNMNILTAIAEYGFCLPVEDSISQECAYALAVKAVQLKYTLQTGWDDVTEVYYSFFYDKEAARYVWRVIFWKTRNKVYPSGVVDLDAETGEILRVEHNGEKPNDYIPYVDRL